MKMLLAYIILRIRKLFLLTFVFLKFNNYFMADETLPVGTLFVDANLYQKPSWMFEGAISAAQRILLQHRGFDGFMRSMPTRDGDFSLILGFTRPDPYMALFVGIPGPNKTPIIHNIYLKED